MIALLLSLASLGLSATSFYWDRIRVVDVLTVHTISAELEDKNSIDHLVLRHLITNSGNRPLSIVEWNAVAWYSAPPAVREWSQKQKELLRRLPSLGDPADVELPLDGWRGQRAIVGNRFPVVIAPGTVSVVETTVDMTDLRDNDDFLHAVRPGGPSAYALGLSVTSTTSAGSRHVAKVPTAYLGMGGVKTLLSGNDIGTVFTIVESRTVSRPINLLVTADVAPDFAEVLAPPLRNHLKLDRPRSR